MRPTSAAGLLGAHTYHDPVGDTDLAPDIFFVDVDHRGSSLSFLVGIANLGPGLGDGELVSVFVDTDRNGHTGCGGSEVSLSVLGDTYGSDFARLARCVSGKWKFGGQGSFSYFPIAGSGVTGPGGLSFSVSTADIGTTSFRFEVGTMYEGVYDDYFDYAGPFSFASRAGGSGSGAGGGKVPTKHPTPTLKPPVIAAHPNVRGEATGPAGAKVGYAPAKVSGAKKIQYSRRSGSVFPLGRTVVTVSASNKAGTTRKTFVVNVADTTPPTLSLPRNVSTTATSTAGATVTYGPLRASDLVDRSVAVSCSAASGSVFAPGTTNVSCTARDDQGNKASVEFVVSVPLLSTPLSSVQTNTSFEYDGRDLVGATTTITIAAPSNPVGDIPTYSWAATSGSIVGNSLTAIWTRETDDYQPLAGTVTLTVNHTSATPQPITLTF
jgi:hypothetical protein